MPAGVRSGPLALVGSGEYLPQIEPVDRLLLDQVGGTSARVVVLATAAGLEPPASPARWVRMGLDHFNRMGARAEPVGILAREDAFDRQWLTLLQAADFVYFSGGDPRHLIQTLQRSPAWEIIRARHAAGAVLAGCSAGAMAFGGFTLPPGALWRVHPRKQRQAQDAPGWLTALGLVPRLIVLPHFDRVAVRLGPAALDRLTRAVPPGVTLVGVEEDTAMVCLDGSPGAAERCAWRVMGRQAVAVLDVEHGEIRHAGGASLEL